MLLGSHWCGCGSRLTVPFRSEGYSFADFMDIFDLTELLLSELGIFLLGMVLNPAKERLLLIPSPSRG